MLAIDIPWLSTIVLFDTISTMVLLDDGSKIAHAFLPHICRGPLNIPRAFRPKKRKVRTVTCVVCTKDVSPKVATFHPGDQDWTCNKCVPPDPI